jgi:hypothetical protein
MYLEGLQGDEIILLKCILAQYVVRFITLVEMTEDQIV